MRVIVLLVMLGTWFAYVQQRNWDPTTNKHLYMHDFENELQDINNGTPAYVSSFQLNSLLDEAQASLFKGETSEEVRWSFNTFEYGEFILGAWDYRMSPTLQFANRLLLLFGLMIPLGIVVFGVYTMLGYPITRDTRFNFFNKTAFALFFVAYASIVILNSSHPHTCHADPRLTIIAAPWAVYAACRGWTVFGRKGRIIRGLMWLFLGGFTVSSALYYALFFTQQDIPWIMY